MNSALAGSRRRLGAGLELRQGRRGHLLHGFEQSDFSGFLEQHGADMRIHRRVGLFQDVADALVGGCQGCGLATMTLREGIKAQILKRIPEITDVLDDTDHESGSNPFFA